MTMMSPIFEGLDNLVARLDSPETWPEFTPEMYELAERALDGLKHAKLDDDWARRLAEDVAGAND